MAKLFHIIGDATSPIRKPAIISHVCNNEGKWGAGFVKSLSARDKTPEVKYRAWYQNKKPFKMALGKVIIVPFLDCEVANMVAQHGIRWEGRTPPIRYEALREALIDVYAAAKNGHKTVHMPRIGCVLAGGSWPRIEELIKEVMTMDTVVYTLHDQQNRWETEYINPKDIEWSPNEH